MSQGSDRPITPERSPLSPPETPVTVTTQQPTHTPPHTPALVLENPLNMTGEDERSERESMTAVNVNRLFMSKIKIPILDGPPAIGAASTGPHVNSWLKILEHNFAQEGITRDQEKITCALVHISADANSSARIALEATPELSEATSYEEFKKVLLENLAPMTSVSYTHL